ncbi:MerR family transcriptional regulator [Streptomyces leeuwenhoekii]|jgi:DNA-binding transcriptional MerR regulator|uniref:MerR family transcriptional regulator n=1 Tax=Streptomyces leeuwenhoekii TaxID=1437453 RepID=UPI00367D3910
MRIGELARLTGVSVRLLRYYEEQGLLTSRRAGGGHRHYTADAVATVARIRALLAAGLPTKVIRDVLPCAVGDGPEVDACVQDLLRRQLHDLDARIAELRAARASLGDLLEASERASGAVRAPA